MVRFWPGSMRDASEGLIGYVEITLASGLIADGLTLRRALEGHLYLGFPCRRDSHGVEHPILRPAHADARREIEAQVFARLSESSTTPVEGHPDLPTWRGERARERATTQPVQDAPLGDRQTPQSTQPRSQGR
jgi:hypothetical protein